MGKVTFEFDDTEDMEDIELIVNRHKMLSALNQIRNFASKIYNGKLYTDSNIVVKDNKVLTEDDFDNMHERGEYVVEDAKSYTEDDYICNQIFGALENVENLLD